MHLHSAYLSSRMSDHILTDCRGTRDGQTEEEEGTKEGQEVETTSGRPRRADWLGRSPIRCLILVQVLELATNLGVLGQRIVEESESVVSLQVVQVRELLAILIPTNLQIIFSKIVHFIVC